METEAAPFNRIKKAHFDAYERTRQSGSYNMIMHAREAAIASGIPLAIYLGVMQNYEKLYHKFKKPRIPE
jgi:hypothetical protein